MHRPRAARTTMTEGVSPTDVRPELASQGNKPTGQSGPILSSGSSLPVRPSSLDARGSSAAKKAIGGGDAASYASGVNTTMATQFQGSVAQPQPPSASRASLVLPEAACSAVLRVLDSMAQRLVAVGISANAITVSCIALGCIGGVFLGFGQFGPAAVVIVIASLGDALDGIVARRSHTASAAGALLDATGDRYQEFFLLGGLTVYFRGFTFGLVVTLLAIAGSFMVSYSSAKAEAMGLPVPPGVMRRPERAVCMCVATALMVPWAWLTRDSALPVWATSLPILAAVSLIAVVANASALRRMQSLSRRSGSPSFTPVPRTGLRAESNGVHLQVESSSGAVTAARAMRSP